MRFLIDAQLPPALSHLVIKSGHLAEHVLELGLSDAEDGIIWHHALSCGAVILTKDEDFASRKILSRTGPAIVWFRVGNCTNRALLRWFVPLLPEVLERLENGEELIELK